MTSVSMTALKLTFEFVGNSILVCLLRAENVMSNRYLPHDSIAGDTKAGTLIATDRFGNKYYENMEELPRKLRCGVDKDVR